MVFVMPLLLLTAALDCLAKMLGPGPPAEGPGATRRGVTAAAAVGPGGLGGARTAVELRRPPPWGPKGEGVCVWDLTNHICHKMAFEVFEVFMELEAFEVFEVFVIF